MLEITNRKRFPVQILVKSTEKTRSFTTLNIPGIGSGKNVYLLSDERATEYIDRLVQKEWVSVKTVKAVRPESPAGSENAISYKFKKED